MTRDQKGNLVQSKRQVYAGKQDGKNTYKYQDVFQNVQIVDPAGFDRFLESPDGEKWLRDYYIQTGEDGKSSYIYEPESLYASFSDNPYNVNDFNSTLKDIFRSQISQ
jgi:hypothetical protein